jgi:hypothetical protein
MKLLKVIKKIYINSPFFLLFMVKKSVKSAKSAVSKLKTEG